MSSNLMAPTIEGVAKEVRKRGADGRFPRSASPGIRVSAVLTTDQFVSLARMFPTAFTATLPAASKTTPAERPEPAGPEGVDS